MHSCSDERESKRAGQIRRGGGGGGGGEERGEEEPRGEEKRGGGEKRRGKEKQGEEVGWGGGGMFLIPGFCRACGGSSQKRASGRAGLPPAQEGRKSFRQRLTV